MLSLQESWISARIWLSILVFGHDTFLSQLIGIQHHISCFHCFSKHEPVGILGSHQYIKKFQEKPVDSLGVDLYIIEMKGRCSSHPLCCSVTIAIIFVRVVMFLSLFLSLRSKWGCADIKSKELAHFLILPVLKLSALNKMQFQRYSVSGEKLPGKHLCHSLWFLVKDQVDFDIFGKTIGHDQSISVSMSGYRERICHANPLHRFTFSMVHKCSFSALSSWLLLFAHCPCLYKQLYFFSHPYPQESPLYLW